MTRLAWRPLATGDLAAPDLPANSLAMRRFAALVLPVLLIAGCADSGGVGVDAPPVFDAIAAGGHHTCGLAGADAFCWGDDRFGQLGAILDHRCSGRVCTEPVPVDGRLDVERIAAGLWHTCATADGTLYCWGYHRFGQLGAGETVSDRCASEHSLPCASVPTPALAGLAFDAVTAGRYHACALARDGRAFCWGENGAGQAGSGDYLNHGVPHAVATELRFDDISTGFAHTCAVATADGSAPDEGTGSPGPASETGSGGRIYCWGAGSAGRLGHGSIESSVSPVRVVGEHEWVRVAVGQGHSCGLSADAEVYCWGLGASGQLGGGDRVSRIDPRPVPLPEPAVAITAGGHHSCALGESGVVYCWGANDAGQLGDGTRTMRTEPVAVVGTGNGGEAGSGAGAGPGLGSGAANAAIAAVSAGLAHTCAVTTTGRVLCWGDNSTGQLGDGTRESRTVPTAVRH